MANILDRYGIKEVADVTFYAIGGDGRPTVPVLYLDTLKVSTIEQTAESADATGGKGNSPLITWDYGKEINVTLEDALFSAKSMAIMFGNGKVKSVKKTGTDTAAYIMRTEIFTPTVNVTGIYTGTGTKTLNTAGLTAAGWNKYAEGTNGKSYLKQNPKFYTAGGTAVTDNLTKGTTYFCTYDLIIKGEEGAYDAQVIEISANSFPGTYYVIGETYARSEITGEDEFFQFIIPKAKVTSENTITLEADGDPSVFNLNLKVLRPRDGKMMKLVKYDLNESTVATTDTVSLWHNHYLSESDTDIADATDTTTTTTGGNSNPSNTEQPAG